MITRFGFLQRHAILILGMAVCLAAVALHVRAIYWPQLIQDDFDVIIKSWTWQTTRDNLLVPNNEHVMPFGRVSTWAMTNFLAGGRPTVVPVPAAVHGPLALVLGMWLLYLFVRRELACPFYGLVAMIVFGVTSVYQQAVWWYSASFCILSLDTLLLGLLIGATLATKRGLARVFEVPVPFWNSRLKTGTGPESSSACPRLGIADSKRGLAPSLRGACPLLE